MSILYIVATPIGNREDITLRALRVLKEVEMIYCEDTRVTRKLLEYHKIDKTLKIYHEHSRVPDLADYKSVAYISDAGTPSLSDPGSGLVAAARERGLSVVPIPGPSALTTLLSVAGVGESAFTFLGFLPHKKGRQTLLKEIANAKRSCVLYEAPSRITRLFRELAEFCGQERKLVVGRELTKMFEEVWSGSTSEALAHFVGDHARGEFVVIVLPV
jgi:16S rRNA (cytidine1402-2'-O)-methyltransferase